MIDAVDIQKLPDFIEIRKRDSSTFQFWIEYLQNIHFF